MSDLYPNIPRQGHHRADADVRKTGTSVRAQPAPDRTADAEASAPAPTYQLSYHKGRGAYRLRSWTSADIAAPEEGYDELGRFQKAEFTAALEQLPDRPRFIVFENTETGETLFGRESNLSDNWTAEGRFDQVTIFDSEDAAAAYADARGGG